MAVNTDKTLQHQLIYSVFVRNHTPEGTFRALERDLDRLSALGTDRARWAVHTPSVTTGA